MNSRGLTLVLIAAFALGAISSFASAPAKDQQMLNQAKILMMEQKWEDARLTFQRLIREFPQSNLLPQAYYHSAYCLRLQKKPEEALPAYELFLQKYPNEPFLATEAGKRVVELALSLVEQGKNAYRSRLVTALKNPAKEVRYLAAIGCSHLKDRELNSLCVPILKEIMTKEKEPEFVNPASIALLRIDPAALAQPEPQKGAKSKPKPGDTQVKMFHLQIFDAGENKPATVELNFPVSLAQLAIAALDEPTKAEIRKKGFDIDNIWESLNRLSPTNILTLRNGPRVVKIWIK
jgi:tetratricopeptide (TPR) repeat protein